MRDGTFIGNFSLEGHAIGSASCYDPIQNVIWNYSSSGAEVVKYSNEGIAPKHRFPLPNKSMRMTPLNNTTNNNNNNTTPMTTTNRYPYYSGRSFSSILSYDDREPVTSMEAVTILLKILDRLSVESMPNPSENRVETSPQSTRLKEPFCVEVTAETFNLLYSLLKRCEDRISAILDRSNNSRKNNNNILLSPKGPTSNNNSNNNLPEIDEEELRSVEITLHCLRILKVNLYRLASSLKVKSDKLTEVLSRSQNTLYKLRDLLLGIIDR